MRQPEKSSELWDFTERGQKILKSQEPATYVLGNKLTPYDSDFKSQILRLSTRRRGMRSMDEF